MHVELIQTSYPWDIATCPALYLTCSLPELVTSVTVLCVCVGGGHDVNTFTFVYPPYQAGGKRGSVAGHSTVVYGRGISYTLQSVLGVSGL